MRRGLRQLGYGLSTTDPGYLLPRHMGAPACGDTLLFTEEASLQRYLGNDNFRFLPTRFPRALLDNKFAFGEYARSLGIVPLPQWAAPEQVALDEYPVVLKARHSWLKDVKIPRGWVCRNAQDMRRAQDEMTRLNLSSDHYFVQKWLATEVDDNFSVCGFWDAEAPQRNLVCVVQRIEGYGDDLSSSAVVSVVPDPDDLVARCAAILDSLAFQGPFEMEFLRFKGCFHVLELNPRFWMQHGLFVDAGNGLLKRYLGMDGERDWGRDVPAAQTWIDGVWLLRNLATLRWSTLMDVFRHVRQRRDTATVCPSAGDAFACLLVLLIKKIKLRVIGSTLQRAALNRTT